MTPRRVAGVVAGIAGCFALALILVPASRSRTERLFVLALVLYAAFQARKQLGVGSRPEPAAAPAGQADSIADEQDVRLARLDASLARAAESGEQFWKATRPALRRLAAERLRLHSGIDVTADPAGARRLMGEDLWVMFATPDEHVGPPPGPERLRVLVERLERL